MKNCSYITSSYLLCNIGTRQGDITSTTIFSLFINELSDMFRQTCNSGIFITDEIPDIICLMYADDIANCAETTLKLQQQINVIDTFCENTGMEVNLQKTEIIVFRNGGNLRHYENWYFCNTQLMFCLCTNIGEYTLHRHYHGHLRTINNIKILLGTFHTMNISNCLIH